MKRYEALASAMGHQVWDTDPEPPRAVCRCESTEDAEMIAAALNARLAFDEEGKR